MRNLTTILLSFAMLGATAAKKHVSNLPARDRFNLNSLPIGANVTLPRTATIVAPLQGRIMLTSTDLPQTVSVKVDPQLQRKAIKVAIYDNNQERVRYVEIKPGAPFLYSFQNLQPIYLMPQDANAVPAEIKIESDKPLAIGR